MAKKTTTKSKPEIAAKRATKSAAKPKAPAPPPPKAVPAPPPPPPVESKPPKAALKAKRVVKKTPPKRPSYTRDDVALRAYFISEKRRSHGLPGDEHQDWLEAERQITAELTKKKTAKKA